MRTRAILLGILIGAAWFHPSAHAEDSDAALAARVAALELAAAFQNDGFKIRDGSWQEVVEMGGARSIAVHLYAGNAYWFFLGAPDGVTPVLELLNAEGEPVEGMPYEGGGVVALGMVADFSGRYWVRVRLPDGVTAPLTLIYSYK